MTKLAARLFICLSVLLLLGATVQWLRSSYEGERQLTTEAARSGYVEIHWDALVPKGWDPLKRFRDKAKEALTDSAPEAMELDRQMRKTWDNAPTNREMNGAKVRLVGYVVPLEANKGELKEFLLVPYFGACIHVPPPPANQIVLVSLTVPVKDVRTMDVVSVAGTLRTTRMNSSMGMSGYSMEAVQVGRQPMRVW